MMVLNPALTLTLILYVKLNLLKKPLQTINLDRGLCSVPPALCRDTRREISGPSPDEHRQLSRHGGDEGRECSDGAGRGLQSTP